MRAPVSNPEAPAQPKEISLRDLAEILVKHFDFHEGLYDVGVKFNIAVGQVGTTPTSVAPGAVISIGGIGISRVPQSGPGTVDAAEVNPLKPKRRQSMPKG